MKLYSTREAAEKLGLSEAKAQACGFQYSGRSAGIGSGMMKLSKPWKQERNERP